MAILFDTANLRIRSFSSEDAVKLYTIHSESAVKKWIPNESYADLNEAESAAAFYAGCAGEGILPFVAAVELKETGELIGDVGINDVSGDPSAVEIGYVISQEYSCNGYATELLHGMTEYVFSRFDINILYGRVLRGNDASVRVLEKNGFAFTKEEADAEDDPYGCGVLVYQKRRDI